MSELVATPSMCYHCFDVLINALSSRNTNRNELPEFSKELTNISVECPLFVTWEKKGNNGSWQLRGCIGTLSPRLLVASIGEYAVTSALRDRRFHPIGISEVSSLRVSVSLLVQYEDCDHAYDWKVGIHGILINFTVAQQHYNATYLPEVAKEQGWDQEKTVATLIQKAGYYGRVTNELLKSIQCTRYQSSKHKVDFEEYLTKHCNGEKNSIPQTQRRWSPCNIH